MLYVKQHTAPDVILEVNSTAICNVLREEMPEEDEVFNTKPVIDSRDLFRHLDTLETRMEAKQQELKTLKVKGPQVPEEQPQTPSSSSSRKSKKRVYTLTELEEQVDHVAELISFMDAEYASTREKLERLKRDGMTSFDVLCALLMPP